MLPPLRALLSAAGRLRPRPRWWLGKPLRATIAPFQSGGDVLRIAYTQGVDWVFLPPRTTAEGNEGGPPGEAQLTAVDAALAHRRLARTEPWAIDTDGLLCAEVAVIHHADRAN